MKLVLIGTGNISNALGRLLANAGHQVLQVYGRDRQRAAHLAYDTGAAPVSDWKAIRSDADLYITAISDRALTGFKEKLQLPGKFLVHTAGSVPLNVLEGVSERTGVWYPLQSIRGDQPTPHKIPFLIQTSAPEDSVLLRELSESIGCPSQVVTESVRINMHHAAVWVNNFPNLLYSIAYRLTEENKVPFDFLLPLLQETADRQNGTDPWKWQTGPALRNDTVTLQKHMDLLKSHAGWQELYAKMSAAIADLTQKAE
ncbi:Rossmann-like and DUF2520 domain-containing protein [Flavihumibacter petaseus]|uniref:DUF2520 domain-containing protein n=1 Tax=Flavihumibacter petaseus NBRC 106054 TaxID=1220578 RepID=A0A0E9N675_9BACT|nr:Rossmann-like and DUF2520 domain-containing protein [Flavihumibacter petaseus]GAO45329.1 hypothetical protein FPE01S_05_00260 [Flavihumibacter petaseus NBRC 106054]